MLSLVTMKSRLRQLLTLALLPMLGEWHTVM